VSAASSAVTELRQAKEALDSVAGSLASDFPAHDVVSELVNLIEFAERRLDEAVRLLTKGAS
jgi:hypothetical protein